MKIVGIDDIVADDFTEALEGRHGRYVRMS